MKIPFQLPGLLLLIIAMASLNGCQKSFLGDTEPGTGTVKVTFRHAVGSAPLVLNTAIYTNPFGENYTINRFKYYVSNIRLGTRAGNPSFAAPASYHLVDQSVPGSLSFSFDAPANTFSTISFLNGVDSARNVSGAQTGALDPLNDMFWTWNSGYIMAKLEGTSPQSPQVGNKIEYHIGGFRTANTVLRTISLAFPDGVFANLKAGSTSEIILEADIDKWWQGVHDIKFAVLPICTTPGLPAQRIADNYASMFRVIDIVNN